MKFILKLNIFEFMIYLFSYLSVIWVDRRLKLCSDELERQGLVGLVDEFELSMCLIPIETDLFSLELPIAHTLDYYAMANSLLQVIFFFYFCINRIFHFEVIVYFKSYSSCSRQIFRKFSNTA